MSRLMVVVLAVAVCIPVFVKSRFGGSGGSPAAFFAGDRPVLVVRIDGDVKRPGVYYFTAKNMTITAILLAEPDLNLKNPVLENAGLSPVVTGSIIRVRRNQLNSLVIAVDFMSVAERMLLGIPLDIDTMERDDFERLPGIGPVLAERIVRFRQLNGGKLHPDELLSVPGIGMQKHAVLKKIFN